MHKLLCTTSPWPKNEKWAQCDFRSSTLGIPYDHNRVPDWTYKCVLFFLLSIYKPVVRSSCFILQMITATLVCPAIDMSSTLTLTPWRLVTELKACGIKLQLFNDKRLLQRWQNSLWWLFCWVTQRLPFLLLPMPKGRTSPKPNSDSCSAWEGQRWSSSHSFQLMKLVGGWDQEETLQQLPGLSLCLCLAMITRNTRCLSGASSINSAKEQELLPSK